ncbi:NAD(+)/NADH kinase [Rosistilla oblonga]|uniref:NAD(+)/NADH kinase n=1 Tax=Rosistilla oblonga TaxID=2527990 RepID=UPI003A96E6A2
MSQSESSDEKRPCWPRAGRSRPDVVVVGALDRPSVASELNRLRSLIAERAEIAAVDLDFSYDFEHAQHDLVIVLGGDGSILQTARQMGENQLPILGVNCGHLGFLAALTPDAFLDIWGTVANGDCELVDHLMLRASIIRDGEEVAVQLGLNEAAILGGPPYRILNIDLSVDQVHATSYSCDGLIISTPIGSTAHNLSAGGPILRKNLQAFVISPISPHTLTHRSVVDTADRTFDLSVANPNDSTSLVVDGRVVDVIQPGDRIRVQRSPYSFQMVAVPGQNDYRTLREKLGWSGNTISKN